MYNYLYIHYIYYLIQYLIDYIFYKYNNILYIYYQYNQDKNFQEYFLHIYF